MNGIRLSKEKRERQPNWTEAEKQLLISLTKQHRMILDNKGSDGNTIKRKSEVWDDIAFRMNNAGYHRSKERLRQQYGRIKSAETKRVKDVLSGEVLNHTEILERNTDLFDGINNEVCGKRYSINSLNIRPAENGNDVFIKEEKAISINDCEDLVSNSCQPFQLNTISDRIVNAETQKFEEVQLETNESNVPTIDQTQVKTRRREHKHISRVFINKRGRIKSIRQLHFYRIAVERERLRSLRVQRKRERQLYLKDLQIQNLKLQILENLLNHNHRNNHINL